MIKGLLPLNYHKKIILIEIEIKIKKGIEKEIKEERNGEIKIKARETYLLSGHYQRCLGGSCMVQPV